MILSISIFKKKWFVFHLSFLFLFAGCSDFNQIFKPESGSKKNQGIVKKEKPQKTKTKPKTRTTAKKKEKRPSQSSSYRIHTVRSGETLSEIAVQYHVTSADILKKNRLKSPQIKVGQKLKIPYADPVEVLANKAKAKTTPKKKARSKKGGKPRFIWPLDRPVTSGFGRRRGRPHDGIDIGAPRGTPIKASFEGTVIFAGNKSGYGKLLIIKHRHNYFSAYAHLSRTKARQNQKVKTGQIIGYVGRTGRASSAHLHFEIRHKTKAKNPLKYLPKR